jgi:O-antigen/teichoic acid export membrane protein
MRRLRRTFPDLWRLALLLLLPLLAFWPVTVGSKTLIPADNLFQWAPWKSYAGDQGLPAYGPENELLSDLLLENYAWKRFLLQSIEERQIPLWNPYILSGTPFLAAGQHSALYPFSLIFVLFPLPRAYGLFTVSQLFLAGAFMYLFARILRIRRTGALVAAITYQLCAFMIVSVDFPMILAGAAWLPFLLAMIELVVRQQPVPGGGSATLPWAVLGAGGLGMQLLAGHGENTYFTLLVLGLYAAWRLAVVAVRARRERVGRAEGIRRLGRPAVWLVVMVVLGLGLGAVQFLPFAELVQYNFREGAVSLQDVLGWSYPWRRVITFLAPNFFGNPSYHTYPDLFTWHNQAITTSAYGDPIAKIDWGVKNYVEGGAYLGVLPVLLALFAVIHSLLRGSDSERRTGIWFFGFLSLASLSFIFPTGTYALLHAIPIINQSHSPFRWVFPLSVSVAFLAGSGADEVSLWLERTRRTAGWRGPLLRVLGLMALGAGGALLAVLGFSRLFYSRLQPLVERVFWALAKAPEAFPDAAAFFSFEVVQLAIAGFMLVLAGACLLVAWHRLRIRGRPLWAILAPVLIAFDLLVATWGFNPAADPGLLPDQIDPQLVRFLKSQPGLWRLTTFNPHGDAPLHANTPWLYDFQDIRGYDSIISKQYVEYMTAIEPQGELLHNRIQPIYRWESLNSPLLDLLNVRFIITSESIDLPKLELVWEGEGLHVYDNKAVAPRSFVLPASATIVADDPVAAMAQYDPRQFVIIEPAAADSADSSTAPSAATLAPADVLAYGSQEVEVGAAVSEPSWLVLNDSYFPGWKAFVRRADQPDSEETEVVVHRVNGNFRGVRLQPGDWLIRFKFSPMSFKLGLFTAFLSGAIILFMTAVWVWRFVYRESAADSTVRRVAKNSLVPMALSVFNRGIDMVFAMLMLRILGAENAGKYYVAINIALWFETLANFGLNTLLTREVSKDPDQANRYLVNTTLLRFLTSLGAAAPIAIYILSLQASADPLAPDTTLAIILLVLGMIPGGINTGLTALFYAYEKIEVPAALATVSTILKVSLQTLALLLGLGFIGLAGVSIIVNLVTMILLGMLAFRTFFVPHLQIDWRLQREMVGESYPLMINHLLATLFFKVDVVLLERMGGSAATVSGNTVVGWYSTAYRWVEALNIIPSVFTLAVFPVISRQAESSRATLVGTYQLAVKLLVMVALPFAVWTAWAATGLVRILGGSQYLPHGAIALQLMIWSIPIGWINSVTNYVLIALGQQRMLTRAFVVGLGFNLAANIVLLPRYGYPAAAIVTIFSELVLLLVFYRYLRASLAPMPWFTLLWRPSLAAIGMILAVWSGWRVYWLVGLLGGGIVYVGLLAVLRVFTADERRVLTELLPHRFRTMVEPA